MDGIQPTSRAGTGLRGATAVLARASRASNALRLVDDPGLTPTQAEADALAALLRMRGHLSAEQEREARAAMRNQPLSFGQVLLTQGCISEAELLTALSGIHHLEISDLSAATPDPQLAKLVPAATAIAAEAVIWRRSGAALVIATSRPDKLDDMRAALPANIRILPALARRDHVVAAQKAQFGADLAREAESRAPAAYSCRGFQGARLARSALAIGAGAVALGLTAPALLTGLVFGLAVFVFALNATLKFAAFASALRADQNASTRPDNTTVLHKPTVSILVPLFHEPEVAGALVDRLREIDYPRDRLDVILAVEEDDPTTLDALSKGTLPSWMRAVVVPQGHPRTKPRALNYALNYARGEIVGIYDAEDRPEPDQIHKVVQRFSEVPQDVACLQGRLDYYNAHHNGLAAMFTVEYAAWFRVLLPGVERMGMIVPLGGTTLFMRRAVLEEVGAWDAHNVTEDAELGLRLARAGYKTQIVDTTTFEEANAAVVPWIRQRSRWLKGYLMTWASAMRAPRRLYQDLGAWRFFGVQVQFLGAVAGFLLAPVLWSLMVKPFGLWHPLDALLSPTLYGILSVMMFLGLIGSVLISVYACRAPHLRQLRAVAPLVEPYYVFGTMAAWLGLFEMAARPFFWAKTTHGQFGGSGSEDLEQVEGDTAGLRHAAE